MARQSRLVVGGLPHLVWLPALAPGRLCEDDEDRKRFLAALRDAAAPLPAAVHAHVLMEQEALLLVTPEGPAALSQLVQGLGRRYVAVFNRRHGRQGPLWDGRFRAAILQPGGTTLDAMLFVELQPVQAGLVQQAVDHPWSSARHHLGQWRDPVVTDNTAYWQLGNTPFEREQAFRQRLVEGLPASRSAQLRQAARRGGAVGDAPFLAQLQQDTGRHVLPRRRGRPGRTAPA